MRQATSFLAANGSLVLSEKGTTAEKPKHQTKNQKGFAPALLRSVRRGFALLTKTYHGSRLTGRDLLRLEVKEQNAIADACGVVGFGSLERHKAAICGDHWI